MTPWPRVVLTSPEQQGHQTTAGGSRERPLTQLFDRSFFMPLSDELIANAFIHSFTYSSVYKAIFDYLPIFLVI